MRNALAWIAALVLLCGASRVSAQWEFPPQDDPAAKLAPPPEQRIDINHAAVEDLMTVPGMTRAWAQRIVRYRHYRTKLDLFENGVVSPEVYSRIKWSIIAHQDPANPDARQKAAKSFAQKPARPRFEVD